MPKWKSMRRCILIVLISFNFVCHSQKNYRGLSFDIGYSQSAQSGTLLGYEITFMRNNINSVYLGAYYSFLSKKNMKISYSIGLNITHKGYRQKFSFTDDKFMSITKYDYRYDLFYAEAPLIVNRNLKYFNLTYGIVPAFCFYNKYHFYNYYSSPVRTSEYEYYKNYGYDRIRGYDVLLNIGLSREIINNLNITCNFRRGLINQNKQGLGEVKYQNFLMLGVAYYIKKNKKEYYEKN